LWLRFPTSAKSALCGSVHCRIHRLPKTSIGPLTISPAAGLHPPCCFVDVGDIEIIKPERDRLHRRFGEHAADRLPAGGEHLIRAYRTGVGFGFLPAEELAVEGKRLLPVGSEQLVPAGRRPRPLKRLIILASFCQLCNLRSYFASAPSASSAQSKACSTPGRGRFRPAPISMVADATDGADGVMGSVPTPWLLS